MSTKGLKYYTNGKDEVMCFPGNEPDGWWNGVSESHRRNNSNSNKGRTPWNKGLTKEDARVFDNIEKMVNSRIKNGTYVPWNKGKTLKDDDRLARSEESIKKGVETRTTNGNNGCSPETVEKILSTKRKNGTLARSPLTREKIRRARIGKILTEEQRKSFIRKERDTKLKNSSFNTSKPEEEFYKFLISEFGEDDVLRQYSDERYPYKSDFYVCSTDSFIELNLFWTHNTHPFNGSEEDKKWIKSFHEKYPHWGKSLFEYDIEKLDCAKKNNLNYTMIYNDGTVYEI